MKRIATLVGHTSR